MFIRNSWYVVAWSDEVVHRQPLGRIAVSEPIVMFRTTDGQVVAFEDRCAHRRMRLSLGRVLEDDRLVCPYHGLTYNRTGACVLVPGQDSANGVKLRNYPVVERWGCVWVWTGAPGEADESLIFDCSWLDRPGMQTTRLYRRAQANYILLNDNLADLLHVAYLHRSSGGGNEYMAPAKIELTPTGDGFHLLRETLNIPAPSGYGQLAKAKGNVDRWHVVDFKAPCFYRIYTGVAEAGTGGPVSSLKQGAGRWTISPHHLITPETETSTHYFQLIGHEWPPSSDSWSFLNQVIDEDVWAIENQQLNIDLRPQAPNTAIASDAPMLEMRKIVTRLLENEAAHLGSGSAKHQGGIRWLI